MKQTLLAIGLSLLFLMNANAQWNSTRSSAWWTQTEASLENILGATLQDSTLTLLVIGANGDTIGIRGQFQFWRGSRYVPQDSLYTIAQIISYVTGLGYITDGNTNWNNTYGFYSSSEEIQDIVGAMVTGNTETDITVTYQDADGTIDFVVTGGTGLDSAAVLATIYQYLADSSYTSTWTGAQIDSLLDILHTNDALWLTEVPKDTLCYHWGVMDTVTSGGLIGYKVESNITVVKVSAYATTDSVWFNIQERAAATPNTAGDSLFSAAMWASLTGKDSTSFSGSGGANFAKNNWIIPFINTDATEAERFGITVWYIKQDY